MKIDPALWQSLLMRLDLILAYLRAREVQHSKFRQFRQRCQVADWRVGEVQHFKAGQTRQRCQVTDLRVPEIFPILSRRLVFPYSPRGMSRPKALFVIGMTVLIAINVMVVIFSKTTYCEASGHQPAPVSPDAPETHLVICS